MILTLQAVAVTVALLAFPTGELSAQPASIAGKWELNIDDGETVKVAILELKQDGGQTTGTYTGPQGLVFPLKGRLVGAKLEFSVHFKTDAADYTIEYRADVTGDSMKGSGKGDHFTLTFTGQRKK